MHFTNNLRTYNSYWNEPLNDCLNWKNMNIEI